MAASILTLFLNNPQQSGSSAGLLDLTQPAASTSTTGWTVGTTAATNYSRIAYNKEKVASLFVASPAQPSGAPISVTTLAEDCWRLSGITTGQFSLGTWYSAISVIAVTNASSQAGRVRIRLWRSSNADATGATELTAGTMIGTTTGALSTTVAATSSASTRIAASNLTNEYVFCQMAWETTTAGTNANADALVRLGPITSLTAGSFLVTSAFSSITPISAAGGGYYLNRRSNDPMCGLDEF